ncbi:two-component system, NarL family, nitrate/nitrite response regulator NarL [Sphingomonas sp. NFR04]|uniref:LuxR C-terminal-related transcriptional regulator n=1 Tax=Sphingomonas sp. NFR04 TaxID=1566283 RepID=UPI0008E32413|nr:response regulator transcription factor [Sphingomonas sp. NFR04]SFJ03469.1 two-component system, NarL family, nitrate/nitrite response regulator NarL [Sphingomonas sp. NFR04]
MNRQLHVSIIGKSEIIREGLRRILIDQNFVVDAAGAQSGSIDLVRSDLVIVDAHDVDEGIETCRHIREASSTTRIVLMIDQYRLEDVGKAFASGSVDGYLVKAISCEPLAGALRLVAMGERVLPSEVADSLIHSVPQIIWNEGQVGTSGVPLSSREIEILRCLMDGDPNKIISRRLNIADATVKVHIKAILRKLRVQNRTQAAIWAASRGFNLSRPKELARPLASPDCRSEEMQAAE